jgi:hypothetical protein
VPAALPEPRLARDTATYPDVLPGVDLVVRATVTGFTHVLVVKSAAAAANPTLARISYPLGGTGIRIEPNDQGGVSVTGTEAKGGQRHSDWRWHHRDASRSCAQ